jgi:hypothetical protein
LVYGHLLSAPNVFMGNPGFKSCGSLKSLRFVKNMPIP